MRATGHDHKGHNRGTPIGVAVLAHDERALRRKLITLEGGGDVLVDLPSLIAFETGDVLVLEDGTLVEVRAAREDLLEVKGRDPRHLAQLIWHIGNRHLPCEIVDEDGVPVRALIGQDHVIADMLKGLGAEVSAVCEPFSPLRGAYGDAGHDHGHHHGHAHGHHAHSHE